MFESRAGGRPILRFDVTEANQSVSYLLWVGVGDQVTSGPAESFVNIPLSVQPLQVSSMGSHPASLQPELKYTMGIDNMMNLKPSYCKNGVV